MGERTEYVPGTFSWTDLGTTDVEGAKSFYQGLFGWDAEDMPAGEMGTYTMFSLGKKSVAACYQQYEEGAPPSWLSYVSVASAEQACAKARTLGATVLQDAFDVLDVGRQGLIADPQGAVLAMWEPRSHIGAGLVNDPGALSWNELRTSDPSAAADFYSGLFDWKTEETDMGPAGMYTTVNVGDKRNGGIMALPEEMAGMPPHWGVYFTVEDCNKAVERVRELGGAVHFEPMEMEFGTFTAVADPQGAGFSLFSGQSDP